MKLKTLYRTASVTRDDIDTDARTVSLAFSSEVPVDRYFGTEILDHGHDAIRLGRLADGGPLLVDHDTSDHVGVVESVSIDQDRRGRAVVRFGKGERAAEIFDDVVDGIRKSVSVGYRVHSMSLTERGEKGTPDTYRVDDWEPLEISLVSVPADASVGIGRADDGDEYEVSIHNMETRKMDETTKTPAPAKQEPKIDMRAEQDKWRKDELARIDEITAIADQFGLRDLGQKMVRESGTVDDMRAAALDHLKDKGAIREAGSPDIGLTDKEVRNYSFIRAMNALANPQDKRAQAAAAYEFECSNAAAERTGKDPQGILVPADVLTRDLTVGTAADGGDTVSTDLLSGSFIDLLRNRAVMMGVSTVMTGLNGNIAIPRQTGGATSYWVAENTAITAESQQAFDQVTMSPNTVGAYTDYSRKLLLQSSIDVEGFVRADLATTLALELDRVAIEGSGTGAEPEGILNVTGIGDVAGGVNGLAPTWDHIVSLETEVAQDNADMGALRYLTNAKARGKLKRTFVDASSNAERVWDTRGGDTPLNGYGALVTNQVPSDLTKGTGTGLSAIIFGNFADLLIGMWSGLDLLVDPYTGGTAGTVRIIVHQDVNLAVRHAESFAAMQDAITT